MKRALISKLFTSMILVVMVTAALSSAAFAATSSAIRVWLDATEIKFDQPPVNNNGTVFVQFKPLFQKLGYTVNYVNETKTIDAVSADKKVTIKLTTTGATVNGKVFSNAKATFVNNRVLVPLRFVGEASNLKVSWDPKARAVNLTTIVKEEPEKPSPTSDELAKSATDELLKVMDTNNAEAYISLLDPTFANYDLTKATLQYYLPTASKVVNAYSDLKVVSSTENEIKFTYVLTIKKPEGSTEFYLDRQYNVQSTIKKNAEGKWLLSARTTSDLKLLSEQTFVEQSNVSADDKKAVITVIENNIKAQNQENINDLVATWDQKSPYFDLSKESYVNRFKNYEVNTTLEKAVLVSYTDKLAYAYVEIKTETKLVNSTFKNNRVYAIVRLTKGTDGKWVADPSNDTLKYQAL